MRLRLEGTIGASKDVYPLFEVKNIHGFFNDMDYFEETVEVTVKSRDGERWTKFNITNWATQILFDPSKKTLGERFRLGFTMDRPRSIHDSLEKVWSPQAAIKLNSESYPTWRTTVELPAGVRFEWKLITEGLDGSRHWHTGRNRRSQVPTGVQRLILIGPD